MSQHANLVIGIGNPLRGDDGVGWHLVEELGAPHRALHQLTPECAALLACCGRVLIVDAWLADGRTDGAGPRAERAPLLRRLVPAAAAPGLSHQLEPAALLWLTEQLYGRRPEAWQLLLPATAMAHGDSLSPALEAQLPQARALLQRWLKPNGRNLAIEG
jgi:hydrogenase maturation protease